MTAPAPNRGFKYETIACRLEDQIRRGIYRFGERIPSIRELCRTERVSPGSVYQAMGLLEARGLVNARPRSGYYVSMRVGVESGPPKPVPMGLLEPSVVGVCDIVAEIMKAASNPALVPLGAALPDPALLPNEKLSRLMASVVRATPSALGRYQLTPGHPELLRQLEQQFYSMECPVAQDEMIVTNGTTEALNLAVRAVTRPGDIVAVESPTYFGLLQILESLGLKVIRVPGDPRTGIDPAQLSKALERYPVKAVALVPSFNNPTGSCLSEERRIHLLNLLSARGVPLIEDDIYGEVHFAERRVRPMKAFDRKGEVLYCSSASKTLAPGLRVGWIAAGRYAERVRRLKWISTLNTSPVDQLVLARFLSSEGIHRPLRRFRERLHNQMTSMRTALAESFPAGTIISEPEGGMFLWVTLPDSVDSSTLYHRLVRDGIMIMPDRVFAPLTGKHRSIRVSFGYPVAIAFSGRSAMPESR